MRRKLIIVGAIALAAATLTTLFFYNMLSNQMGGDHERASATHSVVVAARDLPRGARISEDMLRVEKMDATTAPSDGYASPGVLEGKRLISPVRSGSALLPSHFPAGGEQGLGVAIPPGMRAVTVHVQEYAGIHGMVTTGDRVDVLVASTVRTPGRPDISLKTLLQNVEVLASDRQLESRLAQENAPNVTLLVEASAAAELTLADQAGSIRLVLRNPDDGDTISVAKATTARELLDLPRTPARGGYRAPARPAPQPVAAPAAPERSTLAKAPVQPTRPAAGPALQLQLRLAGLGDRALQEMTQGLAEAEQGAVLVGKFRRGWDAEETFARLERDGALQVFAAPVFDVPAGREATFEQASETPAVNASGEDLDRIGVRVKLGASAGEADGFVVEVAAQAVVPDPDHPAQIAGATLPRITLRRAETDVELQDRQSFWIRGLIDRPGAWDFLRRLFPQRPLERDRNDELVILVTPRLVNPAGRTALSAAVVKEQR
ncbi:MAG: Flp pilus assembly protein CpaB [Acidobacteria bacterium]|nr:Flp pilus assembly protein CpaB [Acidobacteriota bacterium]